VKNRKFFWTIVIGILILVGVFLYLFKPMTMDELYRKPNFTAVVTEVYDKEILVTVDKDQAEYNSSDKIVVSINAELKDSRTSFKVGDKVRIFYDGNILESYPAQIRKVYAILLINE